MRIRKVGLLSVSCHCRLLSWEISPWVVQARRHFAATLLTISEGLAGGRLWSVVDTVELVMINR